MNLEEAINLLVDTFNTIDIRTAAYLKDNCWHSAIFVIRFRKESVDEVQKQQEKILETHGTINKKEFQIALSALPISEWNNLRTNYRKNFVKFRDDLSVNINSSIALGHTFSEPNSHRGYCGIDSEWNSFYSSSQDSGGDISTILYKYQEDVRKLFSRGIHDYLSKIFEMTEQNTQSPPRYIMVVPIFFKIKHIQFDEKSLFLDCVGYPLGKIIFNIDIFERHGSYQVPKKTTKITYDFSGDNEKLSGFKISEQIPSIPLQCEFKIDVFRENGLLIDYKSGTVGTHWPTKGKFTNPYFELYQKFVSIKQLREMIFQHKADGLKAPDKIFERGITWLLNLLGFSAIRLESYENSGIKSDKVSMDIICSYQENHIFLVNVTLGMPDIAMFETERNRRLILSRDSHDETKISSVLFTAKSIKELQNEATKHEVNLISKDVLEKILDYLESGDVELARSIIIKDEFL